MALSPWTVELMRRGLTGVARRAGDPETLERLKTRATRTWQDLPDVAARQIDRVMQGAEAGKATVQRWAQRRTALATPMLNASGVLISEFGTGIAVAGEVLAAGTEAGAGDVLGGAGAAEQLHRRLRRALPGEGDLDIAITANFSAAVAALGLLADHRRLLVHRHHAFRLSDGMLLPDRLRSFSHHVAEVGAANRVEPGDFDSADPFCAVLADEGQREAAPVDLSGHPNAAQAVILTTGTVAADDRATVLGAPIPSTERLIAAGADIVVLPGDGLAGGPECGVVIGPAEVIGAITGSIHWPCLAATATVRAMMCAALETAGSPDEQLPIEQRLAASEPNLQGRAERLALRLSGNEAIEHREVTAEEARLTASGRWRFPSRQVVLKHRTLSARQWQEKLRGELPAVIAAVDGDSLKVDLRWVDPAEDGKLGELLETTSP